MRLRLACSGYGSGRLALAADPGSVGRWGRAAKNWAGGARLDWHFRSPRASTTRGACAVPIPE